jgi:hypothetical protein
MKATKVQLKSILKGLSDVKCPPRWEDVLSDPDKVGQSEYRAIHDLLADATMLSADATISRKRRDHMLAVLEELEYWTSITHAVLSALKYKKK